MDPRLNNMTAERLQSIITTAAARMGFSRKDEAENTIKGMTTGAICGGTLRGADGALAAGLIGGVIGYWWDTNDRGDNAPRDTESGYTDDSRDSGDNA